MAISDVYYVINCVAYCVSCYYGVRNRDLLRGMPGPELTAVIKFYIQQSRLQRHIMISATDPS